jgi:hypothetical protein
MRRVLLGLVLFVGGCTAVHSSTAAKGNHDDAVLVADEVAIEWRSGTTRQQELDDEKRLGLDIEAQEGDDPLLDVADNVTDEDALLVKLKNDPLVDFAERPGLRQTVAHEAGRRRDGVGLGHRL